MTTKIREWCEALTAEADHLTGFVTLSSLVHDLDTKHVRRNVMRQFLREVERVWPWWHRKRRDPAGLVSYIACRKPGVFLCRGRFRPRPTVRCSRVVIDRDFFATNVDPGRNGRLVRGPHIEPRHIRELEINLDRYARGFIPQKRPFAWVTDTKRLADLHRQHPRKKADVTRNSLGLMYMLGMGPSRLLEIRYPSGLFQRLKANFAAPSFLEGSPAIVYRSKRINGWGVTINLENGQDGLPEAVHRKVRFTSAFSVHEIGWTGTTGIGYTDRKLFKQAPTRWSANRISDLERLI